MQSWEHLYPSAAGLGKMLPGFSSCLQISPQHFARIPDVCFEVLLFLCAPDVPVIPSWLFLPFVFGVCEDILSSFYCKCCLWSFVCLFVVVWFYCLVALSDYSWSGGD